VSKTVANDILSACTISKFKILSLILISEPLIISVLNELFEQDVRNVIDMNVVAMPIPVLKNDFIIIAKFFDKVTIFMHYLWY
jgi:Na+-transporting methylmalonyl-CoA/oxaloacetate decarboxylase beta subunit